MPPTETDPLPGKFPGWILAGAMLLACGYLPTLGTPFDFIDDGNLVYPHPQPSFSAHVGLWWEKVQANYEHLGPFRPSLWVHWELAANLLGGDPLAWRIYRLLWCALAAGMLLWLFRELGMAPGAALVAGALAMWNPYRNEIWTSLTLAEGVAMPYALFALIAARKAASARTQLRWEIASALAVLIALGCKNTFAALVPAQIILRMWPSGMSFKEAWQLNGRRSLLLGATLALPAAHFIYFKQHWHPGQYETHGPSAAQLGRILASQKGAMSLDFMAFGIIAASIAIWVARRYRRDSSPSDGVASSSDYRPAIVCALLLIVGGACMYLPMNMMSGRYAMPGVWGLDILFAMLLTTLIALPLTVWKRVAFVGVGGGLAVVMLANLGRQEKFAARAKMLWAAVRHVEANAPPGARVEWVGGDSLAGELNVEEGIHFQWHLYHRGRGDVRIGLYDPTERPLERVELPPLDQPPIYRLCGGSAAGSGRAWDPEQSFATAYWLGRRRYDCYLSRKHPTPLHADAALRDQLRAHLLGELGAAPP